MSSVYVRTQIKSFLTTNAPTEKVADMTGQFQELQDFLTTNSIGLSSPWIGIQFVGNDETPITVGATNSHGKYRENGAVYFHIVDIAKLAVHDLILARAETIRNLLRGARIGDIVIESVTPPNFGEGATLNFDGGYISGSFIVAYYRDVNL